MDTVAHGHGVRRFAPNLATVFIEVAGWNSHIVVGIVMLSGDRYLTDGCGRRIRARQRRERGWRPSSRALITRTAQPFAGGSRLPK